jgi:hypothetical protein
MYDYNRKIFYYYDSIVYICVALNIADNEKVFMKKGEFGTRPPVTGAGFCSKVELLPTAS